MTKSSIRALGRFRFSWGRVALLVALAGLVGLGGGCNQGAEGDRCNPATAAVGHDECNSGLSCQQPSTCAENYCCPTPASSSTNQFCNGMGCPPAPDAGN